MDYTLKTNVFANLCEGIFTLSFTLQIVDAYLHLLQTRSKGEVFTVKYKYKFLKNPEFPKGCVSTGVRLVLIPVRLSGYWCLIVSIIIEPVHEISNNVVCATTKASDQPAHTRSLIRAFASRLSILRLLSYRLNTIWSF